MNKHNTIFTLIQNFLSEAELQAILAEFNYVDSARKCTVPTLISYLIGAATNEWKGLRHAADVGPSTGLVSVDHSSLSKHLKTPNYGIVKRIFEVVVGKLNKNTAFKALHEYFTTRKNNPLKKMQSLIAICNISSYVFFLQLVQNNVNLVKKEC